METSGKCFLKHLWVCSCWSEGLTSVWQARVYSVLLKLQF